MKDRRFFFIVCLSILFLLHCPSSYASVQDYQSDQLKITRLKDNVFQHTSYLETWGMGKVPCNGMIYINGNEAIVFDTPIDDQAANELIEWLGEKDIKAVVVTHFHIDCLGGLGTFHKKDIPSYATHQTIKLATANGDTILPQHAFNGEQVFQIGTEAVYARYYGEGHTKDNIVGYIPSEATLFGGCLIKALNAPKGNLADANVNTWSNTVETLRHELPNLDIVIPGHGPSGSAELLDYTIELFQVKQKPIIFFLHNRFLEEHALDEQHPKYGRVEYKAIIQQLEHAGLKVISEQRQGNVNARAYATQIVTQIDSLIKSGVNANKISVVGTSKGGYIAQYVSTLANQPELNFVFVASFQNSDIEHIPEINYCGNILTIYEKSDPFGVSAVARKNQSTCDIEHFREIELHTGLGHGFLFKPLDVWLAPTIAWAKGHYSFNESAEISVHNK